ncbi:MAG TPA: PadR family transcriptional regulator [Devosia sp.]|nr:PadR family transcriptional regulator [Devosia sp.]
MSSYWRNGEPDWRKLEGLARSYLGRLSSEGNEGLGRVGGNFRIGRMLAAGDLRLVALYLIEQQPRHGYDLIKAIEERSGGFYVPSPGVVYPALTYLEEIGYVTAQAEGNKKLYTITESGRRHLADNREAIEGTLSFLAKAGEQMGRFREFARSDWPFAGEAAPASGSQSGPARQDNATADADRELKGVIPELDEGRKELKAAIKAVRKGTPDQQRLAAEILRRAAREINALGEDDVDL